MPATITLKIPSNAPRQEVGGSVSPAEADAAYQLDAQEYIGGEAFVHDVAYNPKLKVGVIIFGQRDPATTPTNNGEIAAITKIMDVQTKDFLAHVLLQGAKKN